MACPVGKNRPLDEDELEFLERVRSQQRAKERREREQDSSALDAYQLVWALSLSAISFKRVGLWPTLLNMQIPAEQNATPIYAASGIHL